MSREDSLFREAYSLVAPRQLKGSSTLRNDLVGDLVCQLLNTGNRGEKVDKWGVNNLAASFGASLGGLAQLNVTFGLIWGE
jgi:hypothetical protein